MTKRRATILISVSSAIIEHGLRAIAAGIAEWDVAIETARAADAAESIARLRPSLLITEPLAISPAEIDHLRTLGTERMRVAAVYTSALPADVAGVYDSAISIYSTPDSIVDLITDVAAKARMADNQMADSDDRRELSPREKDVVVGVVRGLSNKEIAAAMGVSVNTVTTHRRNIAAKLKIHSPAGLTIYAIVSKLVALDEVAL
ncbi:MAG: LuxR C-terminal-related transcriptional regulator [Paramuribaculum sp.]|jgi:DNA-binding NarL/FixJ family response regulator